MSFEVEHMIRSAIEEAEDAAACIEFKQSVILFIFSMRKAKFTHKTYEFYNILKSCHRTFLGKLAQDFKKEAVLIVNSESFSNTTKREILGFELKDIGLED